MPSQCNNTDKFEEHISTKLGMDTTIQLLVVAATTPLVEEYPDRTDTIDKGKEELKPRNQQYTVSHDTQTHTNNTTHRHI